MSRSENARIPIENAWESSKNTWQRNHSRLRELRWFRKKRICLFAEAMNKSISIWIRIATPCYDISEKHTKRKRCSGNSPSRIWQASNFDSIKPWSLAQERYVFGQSWGPLELSWGHRLKKDKAHTLCEISIDFRKGPNADQLSVEQQSPSSRCLQWDDVEIGSILFKHRPKIVRQQVEQYVLKLGEEGRDRKFEEQGRGRFFTYLTEIYDEALILDLFRSIYVNTIYLYE